jgi:hypothetical protein
MDATRAVLRFSIDETAYKTRISYGISVSRPNQENIVLTESRNLWNVGPNALKVRKLIYTRMGCLSRA